MNNQKYIGWLYLIIATVGGFSMGYAPLELIDINNIEGTFNNIRENSTLFKLSILGDGIVIILELFITILLYQFFEKTDKTWSEIAKTSRLAMTIVMAINIINYIIPLHQINLENGITTAFSFSLETHFYMTYIWQFFFGIHMFALAVLTYKHLKLPNILSVLIFFGGVGYVLDCVIHLIGIELELLTLSSNILLTVAAISEISFALYLLIKKSKTI